MSLYSLFGTNLVPRMQRLFFGTKVVQQDGTKKDTGVQEFVDELLSTIISADPIQLAGTLKLIPPANAPAIQIIHDGGDIDIDGASGTVEALKDIGITIDFSSLTVGIGTLAVDTSGLSISISVSGCTVSASLTGTATLSGNPSLSGTPTVTYDKSFVDLTFDHGLYQG